MEIKLRPPRGPVAAKYMRFVLAGEPPGAVPGAPYVGLWREAAHFGTMGSGKSWSLIDAIILTAYLYPGSVTAWYRASLADLKRSSFQDFRSRMEQYDAKVWKVDRQNWIIEFPSWGGSRVEMIGLDTGDPVEKLRSAPFFRVFGEEAHATSEEIYELALIRAMRQKVYHRYLRDENGEPMLGYNYIKVTANLDVGAGHWLLHRFLHGVAEHPKDHYITDKRFAVISYTWENESANPAMGELKGLLSKETYQKYLSGHIPEDSFHVFPMLGYDHLVEPFKVDHHMAEWAAGLDWGLNHPTVLVVLARIDGVVHVVDAWEARGLSAADAACYVRNILMQYPQMPIYADPSVVNRTPTGLSVQDYFSQEGVYLVPSVKMTRPARVDHGVILIREALSNKRLLFHRRPEVEPVFMEMRRLVFDDLDKLQKDDRFKALYYGFMGMGPVQYTSEPVPFRRERGLRLPEP